MICVTLLTGCMGNVAGDFCAIYTVVDMPGDEAVKLERRYQERILANELYEARYCP